MILHMGTYNLTFTFYKNCLPLPFTLPVTKRCTCHVLIKISNHVPAGNIVSMGIIISKVMITMMINTILTVLMLHCNNDQTTAQ